MKTGKSYNFLKEVLDGKSEIIICYNNGSGVAIINRLYTRYHYSNLAPYHFFIIAKEKSESLADGTLCTINVQNLREANFSAKLFRTNKANSEKIYMELSELYQYDSPKTAFEIFELSAIKEL